MRRQVYDARCSDRSNVADLEKQSFYRLAQRHYIPHGRLSNIVEHARRGGTLAHRHHGMHRREASARGCSPHQQAGAIEPLSLFSSVQFSSVSLL